MIFSIIYWAAGGTGRCYCETATVLFNTTTALTSGTSVATSTTTLLTSTTTTILQNITSTTSIPTTTTITPECPEICDAVNIVQKILMWQNPTLVYIPHSWLGRQAPAGHWNDYWRSSGDAPYSDFLVELLQTQSLDQWQISWTKVRWWNHNFLH